MRATKKLAEPARTVEVASESDLPPGWSSASVLELCEIIRGVSYAKGEASTEPAKNRIPILRANNIASQLVFEDLQYVPEHRVGAEQILRLGDVVVAMSSGSKAVVGKAAQLLGSWSGAFGAFCGVLRPTPHIEPRYFGYYFQTREYRNAISEASAGTNINNLKRQYFADLEFPVAPRPEQKRIVAKLDALLARVRAARDRLARVPGILKRFRQSVLASACSGRLTEDWRGRDATIGWKETNLGAVAKLVTSGSRDWSKYYGRGSGTFLMAQNVRPLRLDLSYRQAVDPPKGDRDRARSQVQPGDLLVTIVGANTGDVCRVPSSLSEHFVCQSVALIRLSSPEVSPYLEFFFNSPEHGRRHLLDCAYGEGRPHLSFDDLRASPIELPPLAEQREIVRRVEALFKLADAIEARVAAATARADRLTQSILARAFRGELVSQDPNEEPASVPLERIQLDRCQMETNGRRIRDGTRLVKRRRS